MAVSCGGSGMKQSQRKVGVDSTVQVSRDSIFLLHVKEIKQNGLEYDCFHYLDTVNLRYSIVCKSCMVTISYHYSTLVREGVVEFHRLMYEDYVNAADRIDPKGYYIDYDYRIVDGKIIESKLHNAKESCFWKYDSLSYLCAINSEEQQCLLTWDGSYIRQLDDISAWGEEKKTDRTNVIYRGKLADTCFSPILLCNVLGVFPDAVLFAYLGLFGQLPVGGSYSLKKFSDTRDGEKNAKVESYTEKYSEEGLLTECIMNCGNHEEEKLLFTWNTENIAYSKKILNRHFVSREHNSRHGCPNLRKEDLLE